MVLANVIELIPLKTLHILVSMQQSLFANNSRKRSNYEKLCKTARSFGKICLVLGIKNPASFIKTHFH